MRDIMYFLELVDINSSGGLPGGVSATCKLVWTCESSSGNPVYPTYAAAYKAAAPEDYATYYNQMTASTGNYTPERQGNMPWQYPQLKVTAS